MSHLAKILGRGALALAVALAVPVTALGRTVLVDNRPGGLNYASAGQGSITHLAGAALRGAACPANPWRRNPS